MFISNCGVLSVIQSSDRISRLPGTGATLAVISPALALTAIIGLLPRFPPVATAMSRASAMLELAQAIPIEPPVSLSAASKNLRLSGGTFFQLRIKN